ncbi:MAG: hypothetical protein AMXMBFR33_09990 [Candidatus Xenobia bacterium]
MIPSITLAGPIYQRPTRSAGEPARETTQDRFQPSEAAASRPILPWPELQRAGLLTATTAVPGPIGALLSQEAKDGLLDFFRRMEAAGASMHTLTPGPPDRARLIGDLTSEQATEKVLTGFTEPLYMRDPKTHGLYPLEGCQDLQLLDTMFGVGKAAGGPRPELARLLRDLTQDHGFRVDSDRDDCTFSREDSTLRYSGSRPLAAYRSALGLEKAPTQLVPPDVWTGVTMDQTRTIEALDYFLGTGADRGLENPELAARLKAIDQAGLSFDRFPFPRMDLTEAQGAVWTYLGLQAAPQTESVWMHRPDKAYFPVHPQDLGDLQLIARRADKMDELMLAFEPRTAALGLSNRFPVFTWLSFEHYPQLAPEVVFDAGIQALESLRSCGKAPAILELREALVTLAPHLKTEPELREACTLLSQSWREESLTDRARVLLECKQNGTDYPTAARERFQFFTPEAGGAVRQEGSHLNVGGVRLRVREPHP